MSLGEQDTFQRRQSRITEKELPLGAACCQVQRLRVWIVGGLAAQIGDLGAFRGDVQPLPVQPLDHLVEQHQHPLERSQTRDATPIGRAARLGRAIDQKRRKVIICRNLVPRRAFAKESVLQ